MLCKCKSMVMISDFFFYGNGWVEFEYIVFELNGSDGFLVKIQ